MAVTTLQLDATAPDPAPPTRTVVTSMPPGLARERVW